MSSTKMAISAKKQAEPIKIFISSTQNDLRPYRSEVETRLTALGQAVSGMEYFGSSPDTPLEVCKEKLRECKLMILIIGVSYGSIEEKSGLSYTELEYNYAEELGIPVLAYIADTSSTKLGIAPDKFDYKNKDRLEAFIARVQKKTVSRFTDVEDLGTRITKDVPAQLEKFRYIKEDSVPSNELKKDISEDDLKNGADLFEQFWLRPRKLNGKIVPLRLRLNKKFSGWKVKDELIKALGLEVGDSITTEVTVLLGGNIIDDADDTDLFADGKGADWLLETVSGRGGVEGCVIDCYARLTYCQAPVGANNKMILKASLVLVDGIRFVERDTSFALSHGTNLSSSELASLLSALGK